MGAGRKTLFKAPFIKHPQTEVSEIITDLGRKPLAGVGLAICKM